jgi:hypothetical protein
VIATEVDGASAGTMCINMDVVSRLLATKFTICNDLDEPGAR